MRALLMTGVGQLELQEIPDPIPEKAGWALVRTLTSAAGLFQTQMLKGMLDSRGLPRILGHEIVGEVIEADSDASPAPGSIVVIDAVVGCGVCEWCIRGEESVCPWMRHLGIDLDGGFAEYVLAPESNIFELPDDVSVNSAVMLGSAVPSAVHAVRRSGLKGGDTVTVSGLGSIGLAVCQVARAFGAARVVAADISEARLKAVSRWVDGSLNVKGLTPRETAERLKDVSNTPRGVDVAYETAGTAASVDATIRVLRSGGTALLMGLVEGPTSIGFASYLNDFVRREVSLVTTFGFTRRDFLVGNRLYRAGRLDLEPLLGETIQLEDVPDTLATIEKGGTSGTRYVVAIGTRST